MRPTFPTFLVSAIAMLTACGGSSSETPWPAEPMSPALGPAGEAAPTGTPTNLPEPASDEGDPPAEDP